MVTARVFDGTTATHDDPGLKTGMITSSWPVVSLDARPHTPQEMLQAISFKLYKNTAVYRTLLPRAAPCHSWCKTRLLGLVEPFRLAALNKHYSGICRTQRTDCNEAEHRLMLSNSVLHERSHWSMGIAGRAREAASLSPPILG